MESSEEGEFCGEKWNRRRQPVIPASEPPTDIEETIQTIRRERSLSDGRLDQLSRRQTFVTVIMVLIAGAQIGLLVWEIYLRHRFPGG